MERYAVQINAGQAASLPQVFESPTIQATRELIVQLNAEYRQKLATLKPDFPEMRQLQAQIEALTAEIDAEVASIAASLRLQLDQANAKVGALRADLIDLEAQQTEFQRKNIRYTILQRDVDSNRAQYDSLIAKLNDVGVGADLRSPEAAVVQEAVRPSAPFAPSLTNNLAFALALSALVSLVIIYVLELLNDTFAVPDQLESELRLPVLGVIPKVTDGEVINALEDAASSQSEAYRTLRTGLEFTAAYEELRTLLITSAESSEGKTSTAFKLASEFAALGRKVLIIDADMRRPQVHRLFRSDNTVGLSNLLTSVVRRGMKDTFFRKSEVSNVDYMTSGTLPPNPVDLLASDRMGVLLHFCKRRYDLVIIDAPPVLGLADAPILSRAVDVTLLVVAARQAKRKAAHNAVKRLRLVGGHLAGVVMTKFEVERLDYNYAYRYMNYGYYRYSSESVGISDSISASSNATASQKAFSVGDFLRDLRRRIG